MSDVEVVIKMPKEMWEQIEKGYVPLGISKYLKNGVTLPNGHSRLFDERDIVNGNYKIIADRIYFLEPALDADIPKRRKGTPLEENDCGYNCENWIP